MRSTLYIVLGSKKMASQTIRFLTRIYYHLITETGRYTVT